MSEKLYGYNGKIAYINLSKENVEVKDLDPQIAKDYLGGTGLSAKIIHDMLKEEDYETLKKDLLAEINPLIFATGPVTGTLRPSSGRYSVSGISPLTGIWGEGTSGGTFCISLHNSGYDALVITGKASTPKLIYIYDAKIEILDAQKYWGKNTYESQQMIVADLNNDKARVAAIGPAGENLVKYAAIINDEGRAVGRCGMGCLMGSKNLKAIAIHGTNRVEIADVNAMRAMLQQEQKEIETDFMKSAVFHTFSLYGTNSYLDIGMSLGDSPGYYFTKTEYLAEKLAGKTLKETFPVLDYGCAGCTLRCGKTTIIEWNGEELTVDGPEYETVCSYGPMLGIFEPKPVIYANHKCNQLGMDTISSGVSISFLIYLVENNIGIPKIKEYLGDLNLEEIKWGNHKLVLKLIDKIAKKEGIGAILAEGTRFMAQKFEVDLELAAHVKGLEMPMHDPRAFAGQALSYMTCCVGANHEKCDWFTAELGNLAYPKLRIKGGDRQSIDRREKGVIALQDLRAIDDSAVNCNFRNPPLENIINYINAATGFNYNRKSLMMVGERINTLKRLINCKLGITRKDDKLPGHLLKVLEEGKTAGVKLDLEKNLQRYYKERGWDWDTGFPTKEQLEKLGIQS
ncbi:MAG: aldehyde ferredoxin oxidoreductase family protein [Promethearchaeota archaeon]